MLYEWDEDKRQSNIDKHGIDFIDAKDIWNDFVLELPSAQQSHAEDRLLVIGQVEGITITVIYTWRGDNRRIISARKARSYEKEDYTNAVG